MTILPICTFLFERCTNRTIYCLSISYADEDETDVEVPSESAFADGDVIWRRHVWSGCCWCRDGAVAVSAGTLSERSARFDQSHQQSVVYFI